MLIGLSSLTFAGETNNPVQDYAAFYNLGGNVIYRWNIDLNNDGKLDALLETKLTPEEIAQENRDTKNHYNANVHGFTVYFSKPDGSGYVKCAGVDDGDGVAPTVPEIDISHCYVGQITQLSKRGIVSVRTDMPRTGIGMSYIYAYLIESDHLKRVTLAEYNPEQRNSIFDQYLKNNVRTQVQLQEIIP